MARSPADAIVALRSMRRRWTGLFAGLDEDESPDALAQRAGADGHSAIHHGKLAAATLGGHDRDLEQILVHDDPELSDPAQRAITAELPSVERMIDQLASRAEQLADRADGVAPGDWARRGSVPGHGEVDALTVLWEAVDDAVSHLKAAEATLREVRGRPV